MVGKAICCKTNMDAHFTMVFALEYICSSTGELECSDMVCALLAILLGPLLQPWLELPSMLF